MGNMDGQCLFLIGSVYYYCSQKRMSSLWLTDHRDMPPVGGFDAIKYKRNLPFRGPSGALILGGVTAVCVYGFYRLGLGNLEKR